MPTEVCRKPEPLIRSMFASMSLARCVAAWLCALTLAVPLARAQVPRAAPDGALTLRILNWNNFIAPGLLKVFEQRHGVTVSEDTFGSMEELTHLISERPGLYDVIVPTSHFVSQLRARGLLATLDKTRLPHARNVDPMFMSATHDPGSRYCVAYLWSQLVVAYHPARVLGPIERWSDLFSRVRPGRIALLRESREMLGIALLILGHSPNTTDPAEVKAARDYLAARAAHVHTYAPDTGQDLLESGLVDAVVEWSGDVAALRQRRPEIRQVNPAEGSVLSAASLCVPRASRHRELAERLIDFLLEPASGAAIAMASGFPTPNVAAVPLLPPASRPALTIPSDLRHRLFLLQDVGTATGGLYEAAWQHLLARAKHAAPRHGP